MGYSPHKRYKGCCAMCGWHTVRGQGYAKRLRLRDMRKLDDGRNRRVSRKIKAQ